MQIMRTRPFSLARDVDAFFSAAVRGAAGEPGTRTWLPRVDMFETDQALTIRFELAGFQADDLELTVEDGVLTLKGERSFEIPEDARLHRREIAGGAFARTIRITDAFDAEAVEASFSDGVLTVTLEKRPEVLPRTIAINAS